MSILNLTDDSFSGDGLLHRDDAAISTLVTEHVNDGASILDIGAQSTRPGAEPIPPSLETQRINSSLSSLLGAPLTTPFTLSIDTYRSEVASKALPSGAHIINDVSAGTMDPDLLASVAANPSTSVILMHMRGNPQTMTSLTDYPDGLIPTIASELQTRIAAAEAVGIRRWHMILDPGIGFAKNADQNLDILRRFSELRAWKGLRGFPWVVGPSRKSFVGKITGVSIAKKRIWGTAACVAAAVQGGADIVRVHDVSEMVKVVKMADAIWRV